MISINELVKEIQFEGERVAHIPDQLHLVGQGRSAAVFRIGETNQAIKVFYRGYQDLAYKEAEIYKRLSNSDYFARLFDVGPGYIILEYLEGITFYDCLVAGIPITPHMVSRVDEALEYAKSKGLNPSDIHLRNIMFTNQHAVKVIDVVRFAQAKECPHWPDLKKAYYFYYQKKFFPKKFPKVLIEIVIRLYRRRLLPI